MSSALGNVLLNEHLEAYIMQLGKGRIVDSINIVSVGSGYGYPHTDQRLVAKSRLLHMIPDFLEHLTKIRFKGKCCCQIVRAEAYFAPAGKFIPCQFFSGYYFLKNRCTIAVLSVLTLIVSFMPYQNFPYWSSGVRMTPVFPG